MSADAFGAHCLLKSTSTDEIWVNFSSPRRPTINIQGCALNALGAQRAASNIAARSSPEIGALSSNARGLQRSAISGCNETDVSALLFMFRL